MKAFRFNLIVLLVAFPCVFLPSIEAKELNKQAIEIKPMSVKDLVKNGKEFLRKKDIETAQAYFEKALKINRSYFYFNRDDLTDTAIVRNLISIYKRKQEWKKAEELYEVYQPYASENQKVNSLEIARMLVNQKNYAEARIVLKELIEDKEVKSAKEYKAIKKEARKLYEQCLLKTEDLTAKDLDQVEIDRAVRLNKLPKVIQINKLRFLGAKYRGRQEYAKSIGYYSQALVLNRPYMGEDWRTDHHIIGCLIAIYKQTGKWKEAEEMYETYGRSRWNYRFIDLNVAEMLEKQGKFEEARAVLSPWEDTLKKPMTTGCGTVRMMHNQDMALLQIAEKKAPYLTKKQMEKILKDRDDKYGRVRMKVTEDPKFNLISNPRYKLEYTKNDR